MVHSSPERDGRTTARTRVPPERQPLRPATALAVLSLLTVLLEVAGAVLVVVAARTGLLEDVGRDLGLERDAGPGGPRGGRGRLRPEAGLRGARDPRGDPRRREAADRGEPAARHRPVRNVLLAHHRGAGALRRHRGGLRGAAVDGRDF